MKQQIISLGGSRPRTDEKFSLKKLPGTFASLPRVLRLVWSTSAILTTLLGLLSLAQGFTPAISVTITALVIDTVVNAIRTHNTSLIWLPVGLQLGITLLSSLLSTLSNIVQQLLQEQVSNRVQLDILKKADTLDLAFFENPEFYDKMRQAAKVEGLRDHRNGLVGGLVGSLAHLIIKIGILKKRQVERVGFLEDIQLHAGRYLFLQELLYDIAERTEQA